MFLVLFRHNKTPKVFCLTFGGHITFCFKRLDVFKKRRVLFLKDGYLLKKDGGLFGKVIPFCLFLISVDAFFLH